MAKNSMADSDHPAFQLAANLKLGLSRKGIRASDLARRTGVAPSVLSEWSSGRIPRSIFNIAAVAKELNVSIEELCFGKTSYFAPQSPSQLSSNTLVIQPGQVIRISIKK